MMYSGVEEMALKAVKRDESVPSTLPAPQSIGCRNRLNQSEQTK